MSYGLFWPNLAVYVTRLQSSVFVTLCRTGSNLKQQPAFILPRAALNITQLGSGQSGKYSANTFLKTKEQKHSHELFWCDGCHSDSSCLLCVGCMVSCFRHVVPGIQLLSEMNLDISQTTGYSLSSEQIYFVFTMNNILMQFYMNVY